MKKRYRVYFAGPQVFAENAHLHFDYVRGISREFGFEALIPWAPGLPPGPHQIFQANTDMLRQADAGVVCVEPFHGTVEPDSGSVWEAGFLHALDKPTVGYMDMPDARHRSITEREYQRWRDRGIAMPPRNGLLPDGNYVENFGYPQNLMIQHSMLKIVQTVAEALTLLEGHFEKLELQEELTRPENKE